MILTSNDPFRREGCPIRWTKSYFTPNGRFELATVRTEVNTTREYCHLFRHIPVTNRYSEVFWTGNCRQFFFRRIIKGPIPDVSQVRVAHGGMVASFHTARSATAAYCLLADVSSRWCRNWSPARNEAPCSADLLAARKRCRRPR